MKDELMDLWQQGASDEPDAGEVARLAAKATVRRFDCAVARRNLMEYGASVPVLAYFGWQAVFGKAPVRNGLAFACVAFVVGYLWWQHRGLPQADPAADARSYQAVLLARVDRQLALLRTVRYWYLLPLYVPPVLQALDLWRLGAHVTAVTLLAVVTVVYGFIARLNARVGVARLLTERQRIASLYDA